MQQHYHSNAKTNVHIRQQIQSDSSSTNDQLAQQFNISEQTVSKWRNREICEDASSRPKNIKYALSEIEIALIVSIRRSTWFPIDEIHDMLQVSINEDISRSSVYRTFVRNKLNKVPQKIRDKAKKFKAYKPGFLHIDVTYLPTIDGRKRYLFVAIDRATRTLFYWIYEDKTAKSAEDFFDKCKDFFPFEMTHILTDNGLEFTNRLIKSKKGKLCKKPSLLDIKCQENNIEHRLTKPNTPKTNGMVERANGIIKNNTILKYTYANQKEMEKDLLDFLVYYNLYRRHGSLKKELKVRTPYEAVQKWHELEPELFKEKPNEFQNKLLNLKHISNQLASTTS